MAALLACGVLVGATGCQSDDAAKHDAKNAAKDAKKGANKAADDVKDATN
jgi:hypothetical protein